jgi:hypothetical protein
VDTVGFAAKVNDIILLPLPIQAMPVIACQDRLLRPLNVNYNKRKLNMNKTIVYFRNHRSYMKLKFLVFQQL